MFFLEMSSDSKNYFEFLVDEISDLENTIESLSSRHLEMTTQTAGTVSE